MTGPTCHRNLRRFWFPLSTGLGIGVTAGSPEEARELAEGEREQTFPNSQFVGEILDVDISALDANHVVPNAGVVVARGVWFPHRNIYEKVLYRRAI